jgi:Na+/phosphate symporter
MVLPGIVKDTLPLFFAACGAGALGFWARAAWKTMRVLRGLPEQVAAVKEAQKTQGDEQREATRTLLRVTDYQNQAHRATLEILSGQKQNGNLRRAFKAIDDADSELKAYTIDGGREGRG